MSIYEFDEFGNNSGNYFSPFSNIQGTYGGLDSKGNVTGTVNPVAMAKEATNNIISQSVTPHFRLDYAISKRVFYRQLSMCSLTSTTQRIKAFYPKQQQDVYQLNLL